MANVNKDREAYRHLQEQFVSGHTGTTVWEIALVVSSAPLAVALRNVVLQSLTQSGHQVSGISKFFLDFICLVLPVLACFTFLPDYIGQVLLGMFLATVSIIFIINIYNNYGSHHQSRFELKYVLDFAVAGKRPYITDFRAYVNVATAISILAVDFVIFPRRFAKAETYGSGLMDVGVGAFIVSNAIVCPEARGKAQNQRSLKQSVLSIMKSVQSSLPLLVLGMCRLFAVKSVDYQEHVSEYGVHWNFFFTLAVVKVLSSIILCVFNTNLSWLVAIAIISGYQYLLSGLNLKHYILHGSDGLGSRNGLIDANREGMFSCLGYCAVFFGGVQLGIYLWQPRTKLRDWLSCLLRLVVIDAVFWVLLTYSEAQVERICRRTANLSYVLWMMAYNIQLISAFLCVDVACIILENTVFLNRKARKDTRQRSAFCLLEAANKNGLFYFLLANVLTGLVNMSLPTISMTPLPGMLVVTGYMFLLSAITSVLYCRNISVKCW